MAFETTIYSECPTPIQWPSLRAAYLRCINIALDVRDTAMREQLDRITALETALARVERENTLLRAECEAARKCWIICNHEYTVKGEDVDALASARAATDAAGILKGAGT